MIIASFNNPQGQEQFILDTNHLTPEQKKAATEMHCQFYDLTEGAEVHCVTREQFYLAHYIAGELGRLDLEIFEPKAL
jgi:hypothetical protein